MSFKIDTDATAYAIEMFRLGYYGGRGARKVADIPARRDAAHRQPPGVTDPDTGLLDCGNWAVSASWDVPADAVSGVYIAKLTRGDTAGASHIPFVVRDDAEHGRHSLSDVRHDLAGLQPVRRQEPVHRLAYRPLGKRVPGAQAQL